jgi:hypothetical protein
MRIFLLRFVVLIAVASRLAAAENLAPNFVVIMAEAQGWPNTSVMMDDKVPA